MSVADLVAIPSGNDVDRTPPQDIAAEQCVLGGMLLSKDAIADVVEVIRPADFYRPAHRTIYDAVLGLYGRGEPADAVTVSAQLTRTGELARVGGAPYLHTLISSVPTAANAGYYARIVRERATLRRLVEAGTKIVQLGYGAAAGQAGDVDEVVDRAQSAVYDVTERRTSEDFVRLEEVLPHTLDEIEAIGSRGGQLFGVPTGFRDLDDLTNGLHPGQMVIIAARPAIGKSTLSLDFARAAAIRHGLPTVVFSLEMSRSEITMRLLSAEARVPLHHMRTGRMSDDDWTRLARRMGEVADAPLFLDDSPNLTMMEIRAKARRLRQRHDLKLVIVDYMQLMTAARRVENRQQEVSELSRSLKLLAKELDVPVVAISQLNRGPEQRTDKKPQLADLRESGCLTADTALLRADNGAPVTFRELLRNGHQGVLVWSVDEHRRLVPAPLTSVFPSGVRQTLRLRLGCGREVKASANHPFLTSVGWLPLEALTVGDRLAIPRRVPAPIAVGLGWGQFRLGLLAHLIGAGHRQHAQPVHYTSVHEAHLTYVEQAAASEFGCAPQRMAVGQATRVQLPTQRNPETTSLCPLSAWLLELGIHLGGAVRRLPEALHRASDEEAAVFLRHLWASGGRLNGPEPAKGGPLPSYASSQRALLDDIALLLARFGIVAQVRPVGRPDVGGGWRLVIDDAGSRETFWARIGTLERPGSSAPRPSWDESVGAENSVDPSGRAGCDDLYWDDVVEIEPLGPEPVFDATVKGTHNFIANGVVAHNSLEQDSDMVILLYREDVFEKESPRAGEADLIVAKHRNGPTATVTVAFQGHYSRFVDMQPA